MSKTVYVTVEALIKLFNEDYGMRLPKNTRFILTSEINKEKEQSYIADLQSQLTEKDKEIKQLKQSQKQLAIEKLTMFEAMLSRAVQWDNDSKCWTISEEVFGNFIVQIDEKIEELKGEETI